MSTADWVALSVIALLALVAYFLRRPPKSRAVAAKVPKGKHAEPAFKGDQTQVRPHVVGGVREKSFVNAEG